MRVSTMIRISAVPTSGASNPAGTGADGRVMERITEFGRQAEARGFPGIWIGDSLGRGRPTLDSLQVLTALAAVTSRVELGISVLQLPLRNPVELAHRVQSLQAMSNNRLILGVGSGSTRDDFELLGYDYDRRFRTFRDDLAIMNRVWNGEPVNGGTLSTWPGCKGGPPILIGAWRSPRWITYAAKEAQGWTPSGRYSSLEDLEQGMKIYREAGGTNAVLANCSIDLAERPESAELARLAAVNFICSPDEARQRIKRVEQMGFEEILIGSQFGAIDEIERVRDFLNA
ncbi:MAG: LLM class flavin-dependent oxidoreductase [Alphaproteobacteria bacterium]|nr:LLM class flavin-dependent oxidoreductase [Alphaproteobacteria bacterium]